MINLPLFISLSQVVNASNPQNADQLIDESKISLISNSVIRFPHAETSNREKSITAPQKGFCNSEETLLQPITNSTQENISLKEYARTIANACSVNLNLCSREMAEEILFAARLLQADGHSLEQIVMVGHWWESHFWKGQRGTPPRPKELLDLYGADGNFYRTGEYGDCCRNFIERWRSTNGLEAERV